MSIPHTNNPADVISAWIALEVLSPQTFRKPQDLAGTNGSIAQFNKPFLPWEGDGEKSKPDYHLYYQVVLGAIDFEKAIGALLDIYADKRVERPSSKGEAILAVVILDNRGLVVGDPAVYVSSFAWGFPQALKGSLTTLSEWNDANGMLTTALDKIIRRTDDEGEPLPLNKATINQATSYLINTLGLPTAFITDTSFAVRTYEYHTNTEPPEPLFLNSFFIEDLILAKDLFKKRKAPSNLQRYIGLKLPNDRKDLLHDITSLENAVAPSMIPPARWPGWGRHPLVLLQQAAVNLALRELRNDGILAVNGPPGTGKTTLLRDIVAGIVTSRAEAMCAFADPVDAFVNSGERISAGPAWLTMYELDKSLKGFEILIASSNNKAVENVSTELPGLNAIAEDIGDLRYFTSLFNSLLERESWGLIAAVLGNAANRSRFKQHFWWNKETGLSTYLAEASGVPQFVDVKDPKSGKVIGTRKPKIVEDEDAPNSHQEAVQRWKDAKSRFQLKLKESNAQLSSLEKIRKLTIKLAPYKQRKSTAKHSLREAETSEVAAKEEVDALENMRISLDSNLLELEQELLTHLKRRPGFFARLFRTTRASIWKQENRILTAKIEAARAELARNGTLLAQRRNAHNTAFNAVVQRRNELVEVSNKLSQLEQSIAEARRTVGPHMIDDHFFELSHEMKHIVSPWCNKKVQQIRDEVFIEAIRLHKAFVDAAAKPIRHNLGVLMMVLSGRPLPDEDKQRLLPDLWSSLFLVVPSVSTTFASVERMVGNLPAESLGWLLIDEAGQALPQAAVGALIRTKRAVVVGDPIQIEPVVTLPGTLTQNICRQFAIDPNRFNAPEASAQTLADAATPYYAVFEGRHGSRLVGVPLLVHRRCEDPMFSISNAIAYERLMVQAKNPGSSHIRDILGPSQWIDIKGQAQEKWCQEEGEMVLDMLQRLRKAGIVPDLYIVTPFVIVADNLRKLIRDSGILTSWVENVDSWPYERIGTVHTVQGREAEAIFFVLGAPSPQQTGARDWAGGKPNLLNVAVTRAKEVLYVIGNRQLWKAAGLFEELTERI